MTGKTTTAFRTWFFVYSHCAEFCLKYYSTRGTFLRKKKAFNNRIAIQILIRLRAWGSKRFTSMRRLLRRILGILISYAVPDSVARNLWQIGGLHFRCDHSKIPSSIVRRFRPAVLPLYNEVSTLLKRHSIVSSSLTSVAPIEMLKFKFLVLIKY